MLPSLCHLPMSSENPAEALMTSRGSSRLCSVGGSDDAIGTTETDQEFRPMLGKYKDIMGIIHRFAGLFANVTGSTFLLKFIFIAPSDIITHK